MDWPFAFTSICSASFMSLSVPAHSIVPCGLSMVPVTVLAVLLEPGARVDRALRGVEVQGLFTADVCRVRRGSHGSEDKEQQ
jgi:hypothetical protein